MRDVGWQESLELLMSRPTVNIEGLVGGYTGPAARRFFRTAQWQKSICAWFLT